MISSQPHILPRAGTVSCIARWFEQNHPITENIFTEQNSFADKWQRRGAMAPEKPVRSEKAGGVQQCMLAF